MAKQEPKFYVCDHCHIIIEEITEKKCEFTCCGVAMEELIANTSDGAHEKHLPVAKTDGNTVTVNIGSILHPMTDEHSIEWVYLQTEKGCQRIHLCPSCEPTAVFTLIEGDQPIAAYAYCNLHGFWKTEL